MSELEGFLEFLGAGMNPFKRPRGFTFGGSQVRLPVDGTSQGKRFFGPLGFVPLGLSREWGN